MPTTDLKLGTFALIPFFISQKGISKKLQQLLKGPDQIVDKPTEVTFKITDSNKKEIVQHRNNLINLLSKRIRTPRINSTIFFHRFTNCSEQSTNRTKSKHQWQRKSEINPTTNCTPSNILHIRTKNISKRKKIRKMTKKFLPQVQQQKSEHRQSSRLRSQPQKDYKTFIPQSKLIKKVEFQKQL